MEGKQYSVTLKGFKDKKQADEFIHWFSSQGEQYCEVWFEDRELPSPMINCEKPYVRTDDEGQYNITAEVKYYE